MYSRKSTIAAVYAAFPGQFLNAADQIQTWRSGQWSLCRMNNGTLVAFLRIGTAWHGWDNHGSWSGYRPNQIGGLGDVISTDAQLRTYERNVANAPAEITRKIQTL